MTTVDGILNRVRAFRRENGLSLNELARRADLPPSTIAHLDRPDWSCTVATLRQLEKVLQGENLR